MINPQYSLDKVNKEIYSKCSASTETGIFPDSLPHLEYSMRVVRWNEVHIQLQLDLLLYTTFTAQICTIL